MHCINLNTITSVRYKNKTIGAPSVLRHLIAIKSWECYGAYLIYKRTDVYHSYKRNDDTIVKHTFSLNHNIHINAINNITSPQVLYINNPPRCLTYITLIGAFTTIDVSMRLIYYMHWNVNYNILSGALNKQYKLVL